jgi:hypothetical protein
MGIESRVTGTGPIGATMQPMVVDLTFKGKCFGKLQLPEVRTASSGTAVNIYDQDIKILDMDAFKAFVKSLMNDEDLVLTLDNGECSIKALGLTGRCTYKKDIYLKGMNGPPSKLKKTDKDTNTMAVHNQSPLEIDHGVSKLEIQDSAGNTIAEFKGPMEIKRGDFDLTMNITRKGTKPSGSEALLVGTGTENNAWTNETLKYIRVPLQLTEEFTALC